MPGVTTALRASGAFEKAIALEELDMAGVMATVKKISAVYKPVGCHSGSASCFTWHLVARG